MSCTELASKLSGLYRNTSFDGLPTRESPFSPSLKDYLATHGLLLTVCFPNSCSLGFNAQFFSASWIQQDLGTRIIPSQSGVGLILDPSLVDIQCIYPTDAGTLSRDSKGCGPMMYDLNGGSKGAASYKKNPIKRHLAKTFYTEYKNINFGRETQWQDVDCMEFFGLPPIELQRLWGYMDKDGTDNNSSSVQYYSLPALSNLNVGAILGHDVCSVDLLPESGKRLFPLYYDAPSWAPEDFKQVMELQMDFIQNETTREDWIWNEFVLSLPVELPQLVQGVFYVNENYTGSRTNRREAAQRQAKTYGGLPVFILHNEQGWDGDVLECDGDQDIDAAGEEVTTNNDYSGEAGRSFQKPEDTHEDIMRIHAFLGQRRYQHQHFEMLHLSDQAYD